MAKVKTYYFIDINLISKAIVYHGATTTATHDGDTGDPAVHRMFVSKGQYNKFVGKLAAITKR